MFLTENIIRWILFLINPFAAAVVSFIDYNRPLVKNIFWAFCAYYGFTFAIGNESVGTDILEYWSELRYLYEMDQFSVFDIFSYYQSSGEVDILRTFLSFVISRFTDSRVMLTTTYTIIFGFFYSRNIWYLFSLFENKLSIYEKALFFALVLVVPIWFINGFRMWTAFHVFFYGLLPYIFERKKGKLIVTVLSFWVHFSFIIPIGMVFLYILLKDKLTLFFIAFVISIFVNEINIRELNNFVEMIAPQSIVDRSASYRDENRVESMANNDGINTNNWYVKWYTTAMRYALYFLIMYIYVFGDPRIKIIPEWKRLLSLLFIFFTVGNFLSNIPSGGRFLNFGYFLGLILCVLYLNEFRKDYKTSLIMKVLSPVFLLFIIVAIRISLYSTSLMTIFGNPLMAMFNIGETASINDFIK